MIALLRMRRARQVAVQALQRAEPRSAEIAAVAITIPSCLCGISSSGRGRIVPADLLVGEDVVGVDLAAIGVDFLAVDAGGAGAGFEMDADAGEVGVFLGTPWAFYGFADVFGGFEVLYIEGCGQLGSLSARYTEIGHVTGKGTEKRIHCLWTPLKSEF